MLANQGPSTVYSGKNSKVNAALKKKYRSSVFDSHLGGNGIKKFDELKLLRGEGESIVEEGSRKW